MKIAIVSNGYFWLPDEPGPSRFYRIAELFAAAGHTVTVFTTDYQHFSKSYRDPVAIGKQRHPFRIILVHSPEYKKNIDARRLFSNSVTASNMVKGLEEAGSFDAVYCSIPSNRVAARVSEWCRKKQIPFVIDIEDLWPEAMHMVVPKFPGRELVLKPLEKDAETAYANASAVIGTSGDYTMRAFRNRPMNIPHETVFVGSDLDVFDEGVRTYAKDYPKPEGEAWITYAGTIGASYDIKTLIDAAKLLDGRPASGAMPKIRFRILGTGPKKEEMEAYAMALRLGSVEFLGYMPYPKMAAVLTSSDISVNSFIKGAPQSIVNKVGDYLAAGIPMINTLENPIFTKMVLENGFGVNVPPEDPRALADAIVKILSDPAEAGAMGKRARVLAETRFDRKTAYQEIIRTVEQVLA